jgi:hypothetical protein
VQPKLNVSVDVWTRLHLVHFILTGFACFSIHNDFIKKTKMPAGSITFATDISD